MYSPAVIQRFQQPEHSLPAPDGALLGTAGIPGDGPYAQIWISYFERDSAPTVTEPSNREEKVIKRAGFRTYGCPAAVACSDLLCTLAQGRTIAQALMIEPEHLMLMLGGLPEGKEHAAELPVRALRKALGVEN